MMAYQWLENTAFIESVDGVASLLLDEVDLLN